MKERRLHPRLELPLPVELVVEGDERHGTLENLSAGGAALRFPEGLLPGNPIERLRFHLPGEEGREPEEIVTAARVVRVEPLRQPGGEGGFRLGVSFDDLPEETFRRVQQFIFRRLTKGRPEAAEMPLDRRRVVVKRPVAVSFGRFDEFVSEMSENISLGGMFLRTSDPKPPGSEFTFQLRLGEDFSLIEGRAEVVWTRRSRLDDERPAGMGVRFLELDEASRRTIAKLVQEAAEGERLDKPASGSVRVAAVYPKTMPPRIGAPQQPSPARHKGPASEVEKLRAELGRRTRAYEAKVEELANRIAQLSAGRRAVDTTQGTASSDQLEQACAALEKQTQALQEEKNGLVARCRQLEHEQDDLRAQLGSASDELAAQREEARKARAEVGAARRSHSGLDNRLRAVEQALRHTEGERDRLKERIKELGRTGGEMNALVAGEKASPGITAEEHDALRRRFEAERAARRELGEELSRVRRERAGLEERLAARGAAEEAERELAREHAELESRLETLEAEHSNLEILLAGAGSDREDLESEVARLRDELQRQKRQMTADEAERRELEEALGRARSEVEEAHADGMRLASELRGRLERFREEGRSLGAQVARLEEEREDLERELAASRESDAGQRRRLAELAARHETLASESVAARAADERRLGTLEWLLGEARGEARSLAERLGDAEAERDEAARRLEVQVGAIEEQRSVSVETAREQRELTDLLQAVRGDAAVEREARETLAARVGELEERGNELAAAERSMRAERDGLTRQLGESAEAVERLEERVATLENQLEASEAAGRDLREEISRLESESEELRSVERSARTQSDETARQLGESVEVAQRLEERVATLENRLEASEAAGRDLREEISRLEVEAEELRRERQILETQARTAEEEADERRAAARQRERELAEQLEEELRLGDERARAVAALEADLGSERERAAELVADVRVLEERLTGLAATAEAGVAPLAPAPPRRRPRAAGLRRAAGIAGGGILLGALLWGGWHLVPRPGTPAREATLPVDPAVASDGHGAVSSEPEAAPDSMAAGSDEGAVAVGIESPVAGAPDPEAERPAPGEAVLAWAAAWSEQDVEGYLGFYAREFVPPNGAPRAEWEAFRRERLESPPWIEVVIADLTESDVGEDRVAVTFRQDYAAGAYSDRVEKTLVLVWEDSGWKILDERAVTL